MASFLEDQFFPALRAALALQIIAIVRDHRFLEVAAFQHPSNGVGNGQEQALATEYGMLTLSKSFNIF